MSPVVCTKISLFRSVQYDTAVPPGLFFWLSIRPLSGYQRRQQTAVVTKNTLLPPEVVLMTLPFSSEGRKTCTFPFLPFHPRPAYFTLFIYLAAFVVFCPRWPNLKDRGSTIHQQWATPTGAAASTCTKLGGQSVRFKFQCLKTSTPYNCC